MTLIPIHTLNEQVGQLEKGQLFLIKEFKDGQLYIRNKLNGTKPVDFDTLKEAVAKSDELAAVFTKELLDEMKQQ